MGRYALRRLWQMIPVMLLVSIAIFSIIHFIPGNPAQIIAGPNATPEHLAALEQRLGLDQPVWMQYLIWLRNALSGDLGISYINKFPVATLIAQRIPATVELAVAAALQGAVRVFGNDIQPEAMENCAEHARMNGVEGACTFALGGHELIDGKFFDVILANINTWVIADAADTLFASLSRRMAASVRHPRAGGGSHRRPFQHHGHGRGGASHTRRLGATRDAAAVLITACAATAGASHRRGARASP